MTSGAQVCRSYCCDADRDGRDTPRRPARRAGPPVRFVRAPATRRRRRPRRTCRAAGGRPTVPYRDRTPPSASASSCVRRLAAPPARPPRRPPASTVVDGPDASADALLALGPVAERPAARGRRARHARAARRRRRTRGALWDAAGLLPGRLLPAHEVRVRPGRDAGEVADRLGGDELLLHGAWPLQDKVADDVEQLLTANSAFRDHPVATWRPATSVGTLTPRLAAAPSTTRPSPGWSLRVLRHVARPARRRARCASGCSATAPSATSTPPRSPRTAGLELAAVCDPRRGAGRGGPGVRPARCAGTATSRTCSPTTASTSSSSRRRRTRTPTRSFGRSRPASTSSSRSRSASRSRRPTGRSPPPATPG